MEVAPSEAADPLAAMALCSAAASSAAEASEAAEAVEEEEADPLMAAVNAQLSDY